MKQVNKCDGTVVNIAKVEISGDIYAWDFWYYTEQGNCIFSLEIDEDLEDIEVMNKYIEKWTKRLRRTRDNKQFSFVVNV